ncbi:MAG: ribbon-helix-helix protein, CopG family, partial [Egibacteraceae bacterium]
MAMHRTQVLLEPESYEQLKAESQRTGRSIGDLVREVVAERY